MPRHGKWRQFAGDLWREIRDDHVIDGAAVLAFFFLLAVFPATIFVFSLLPALSIPHLQQAMLDLLSQVLPGQTATFFRGTVQQVSPHGKRGLLTFGLIFALWSGSSGVYAIMEQLNVICDVRDRRPFWKARGTAILLMLFFAVLAIGSLSLVIFGGVIQSSLASMIGWSRPLLFFFAALRWMILATALLLALAAAYSFGPDAAIPFRLTSPGNITAAGLIAAASIGFRIYVSRFGNYSAIYGSLAAIIILMLWMYLAGMALLIGGEVDALLESSSK
jgi:membrane protein